MSTPLAIGWSTRVPAWFAGRSSAGLFVLWFALSGRALSSQSPAVDPRFGPRAISAFVDAARSRTLAACAERGCELPADFLAWIDADRVRRATVYGCRAEPLPVLLMLRSLELDLGAETVRRDYPQLALAFAIQSAYAPPRAKASDWNDGDDHDQHDGLPDITARKPLRLTIPGDPRVRVDTKDKTRELDRDDHVINFLEDHPPVETEVVSHESPPLEYDAKGVAEPRGKSVVQERKVTRPLAGADVIASVALQTEFNTYMREHGHADVQIDCGDRAVHWQSTEAVHDAELRRRIAAAHELFHTAYRNKGRMPAARDRAPTPAESMAWFVRNDRHPFTAEEREARQWPKFPLNAPWPLLLMLAADDQPLREREDIWIRFRDRGEFRTYGEYIGGIAQQFDMQSARRVSPLAFSYGSIQMMWKDGGVCGTMGNIGARTYRICGVPASTAGQPGHCAIVFFEQDRKTGQFRCRGGQYATGGDEVTTVHAGWNYDGKGGRRPMVFHQAVAFGVNHGLASFVDTLVLRTMWDAATAQVRAEAGLAFATAALALDPFALPALDRVLATAPSAESALAILDAFSARVERLPDAEQLALYCTAVRDLAHARVLALPAPADKSAAEVLWATLERQGCELPELLARTWRQIDGEAGFARLCRAAVERYLASPERSKNRREGDRFAARLQAWGKTIAEGPKRQAWASDLLAPFAGREALRHRGKPVLDPAVAALCKLAGRDLPKLSSPR